MCFWSYLLLKIHQVTQLFLMQYPKLNIIDSLKFEHVGIIVLKKMPLLFGTLKYTVALQFVSTPDFPHKVFGINFGINVMTATFQVIQHILVLTNTIAFNNIASCTTPVWSNWWVLPLVHPKGNISVDSAHTPASPCDLVLLAKLLNQLKSLPLHYGPYIQEKK